MTPTCPYCSGLLSAVDHNNFCSQKGDVNKWAHGNAFFIRSAHLSSGEHISRFTVRAVLSGYQYYNISGRDVILRENNYLIVHDGQKYYTQIDSFYPTESIIVAYGWKDITETFHTLSARDEDLLDGMPAGSFWEMDWLDSSYEKDFAIRSLLREFVSAITRGEKDAMYYEQLRFLLLEKIFYNHVRVLQRAYGLQSRKDTTRQELLRRLYLAGDYMRAHLEKKLTIAEVSSVVAMSPYHFFRVFKQLFGHTPLEYLTRERLTHARNLIGKTDLPVSGILQEVGYDNPSSFSRLFRNYYGYSPRDIRKNELQIDSIDREIRG
ncbi:AraC family transcriptional regulator [Sinomicrobium weinanense]|uniref:Helix-turn-helix transcriptional regulator n=1 Tax=Sinomicrobium weinanense TaxID=2842200 RepID=A0A926JRH5_9FLAO|nr:AraC family transcriptional regulator [Sinomicrobium weinanense]MBC9796155.1 helix-turn-helix transcriptional regulator [Sinomicrobium weinanense]MBU3121906.1 AraC family transcriptional regulator [Sinomicrobium weinanense]